MTWTWPRRRRDGDPAAYGAAGDPAEEDPRGREQGGDDDQVYALNSPARLKAEQGDIDAARTLLRVADAQATGIPHLIDEADRIDAHHVRTPTPP
jgi:hypothetical protein